MACEIRRSMIVMEFQFFVHFYIFEKRDMTTIHDWNFYSLCCFEICEEKLTFTKEGLFKLPRITIDRGGSH